MSRVRCTTLFGHHRFEGRFDEAPNRSADHVIDRLLEGMKHGAIPSDVITRDLLIVRTYVRDICIICGDTIERNHG